MLRNYLGFPAGVTGAELDRPGLPAGHGRSARDFVIGRSATAIRAEGDERIVTLDDGSELRAGAVVIATGVSYRRMGIERLEALVGRGVFYGSGASEARAMAGEPVFVVGGANSAGAAAVHLARHADQVTLLVRGGSIVDTMSDYLIRELDAADNIDMRLQHRDRRRRGEFRLSGLSLRDRVDRATEEVAAAAVFILIGAAPQDRLAAARDRPRRPRLHPHRQQRPGRRRRFRTRDDDAGGVRRRGRPPSSPVKRVAAAVGDGSTRDPRGPRVTAPFGRREALVG